MIGSAARLGLTRHTINALCESFFATLECELLDRRRFATQVEARLAVFEFIEGCTTRIVVIPPWTTSPQ